LPPGIVLLQPLPQPVILLERIDAFEHLFRCLTVMIANPSPLDRGAGI
jgi:hypothetical protein